MDVHLNEEVLEPNAGQVLAQDRAPPFVHPVDGENGFGRVNGNALNPNAVHLGRNSVHIGPAAGLNALKIQPWIKFRDKHETFG